jgi:hypothetical protein
LLGALALILAAAPAASSQSVLLQMRPRLGDTLRMRLDQRVEMTGTTRMHGADSTVRATTVTRVLAHSVVKSSDPAGTTMVAITDSVFITGEGGRPLPQGEHLRRTLQGRRVHLRVAPDGATEVMAEGDALAPELRALFAQMPATLPRTPVAVGDTWTRTMDLPGPAAGGARSASALTATFRLDSLSRRGQLAHLSMRGALSRRAGAAELPEGMKYEMAGLVSGTIAVDRRRGWMTDARTTLTVNSTVTLPRGAGAEPMKVHMKVTQWLRAM